MRIITKVLENRTTSYMPMLISEFSECFCERRLISYNILLVHEVKHCIKNQRKGEEGFWRLIKIYISKAYDRVSCNFLRNIMIKMGLGKKRVDKVMKCVETVSFTIKVNGNMSNVFYPRCGVRQRDPIYYMSGVVVLQGG